MISFDGKNVLFITTKNLDYIRNVQEIELIQKTAKKLDIIGSKSSSYIKRLWSVYTSLLVRNCKKYDIIFVGFAPQLVVPIWGWKFKKAKLVIDFFISVYDTLVFDRKKFSAGGLLAFLCKFLDKMTLQGVDFVLSDTIVHGDFFSQEFNINRDKITTLYLQADKKVYYPRKKIDNRNEKIILYFGSALPLQGIDVVLKAVELLKEEPDMKFILIGPMEGKYAMPQSANVEYYRWLSQEELAEKIAMADLCLAGHFNDTIQKAKRTIPGKAYIYYAMERPMILGDNQANRELYSEEMQGIYFVEMGNSDALAKKIKEILQ